MSLILTSQAAMTHEYHPSADDENGDNQHPALGRD